LRSEPDLADSLHPHESNDQCGHADRAIPFRGGPERFLRGAEYVAPLYLLPCLPDACALRDSLSVFGGASRRSEVLHVIQNVRSWQPWTERPAADHRVNAGFLASQPVASDERRRAEEMRDSPIVCHFLRQKQDCGHMC
jgi:hypothetical protein